MNYLEKVNELVYNFVHPCDAEVPAGYYRRVKWEKYNPNKEQIMPAPGVEWDTEVIPIGKQVFTEAPFQKSTPFPEPPPEGGNGSNSREAQEPATGIWCSKLGIYFTDTVALSDYIESIGATELPGQDWYGADIYKSALFKTQFEHSMYLAENAGGTWKGLLLPPVIDRRTMMEISADYVLSINFYGIKNERSAYLKHYEDKPCTFVGFQFNSDVDSSTPPSPVPTEPFSISPLPPEFWGRARAIDCIPFEGKFPYSDLSKAILAAWNESSDSAKLYWQKLKGLTSGDSNWSLSTMYQKLSSSMQELGQAALAMGQDVLLTAWNTFMEVMTAGLGIVGGAWDVIKSFLPSVIINGESIDIQKLCTEGVDYLQKKWEVFSFEETINQIYSAIGSSYEYAKEKVKIYAKDLSDAFQELYTWAWQQLMSAGTALSLFLTELTMKLFEKPSGNPLYKLAEMFKNMFLSAVKPLDKILSGTCPGFKPSDIYKMVMDKVQELKEAAYKKVQELEAMAIEQWQIVTEHYNDYKKQLMDLNDYIAGVYGSMKEEIIRQKEEAVANAKALWENAKALWERLKSDSDAEKFSVKDILSLAYDELMKLPIISVFNEFLGYIGTSVEQIMELYELAEGKVKSLYKKFSEGSGDIKQIIREIYNKISSLALSVTTQVVNKVLGLLGLTIEFSAVSMCIPVLHY